MIVLCLVISCVCGEQVCVIRVCLHCSSVCEQVGEGCYLNMLQGESPLPPSAQLSRFHSNAISGTHMMHVYTNTHLRVLTTRGVYAFIFKKGIGEYIKHISYSLPHCFLPLFSFMSTFFLFEQIRWHHYDSHKTHIHTNSSKQTQTIPLCIPDQPVEICSWAAHALAM